MQYGDLMIAPMRRELTNLGLSELLTPEDVDRFLSEAGDEPALIAINSICGCAAGSMRPAVAQALDRGPRPAHLATVFAGQEKDATARVREHITEYPPSSPSVALFKGGRVVFMLERHQIQGRAPEEIAEDLVQALETHVGTAAEG